MLREKRIYPRDLAVVEAMKPHMNTMSGRIMVRLETIAEELGTTRTNVSGSFARLQREFLAIRCKGRTSGGVFFLLNPYYVSIGGQAKRAQLWMKFKEALDNGGLVSEATKANWLQEEVDE